MSTVTTMQSLGTEPANCAGCDNPFMRGETIAAIPFKNGKPSGWYCAECTADWRVGASEFRRAKKENAK